MAIEAEVTQGQDVDSVIPDVSELSREELEEVNRSTPEEIVEKLTATGEDIETETTPEGETPAPVSKLKPRPTAKPGSDEAIEVDLGNGRKISFKNRDELIQNFSALRNGLDVLNGKHGQTVQELQRMRGMEQQVTAMQKELEDLKRAPAKSQAGQPATATPAMVQAAESAGVDPDEFFKDLTPENFASKMVLLRKAATADARKELEPTLQEIREENKKLREEFGQIRGDMTYREQKTVFESHLNNLMNDITALQTRVPAIKTQWSASQINQIVAECAQAGDPEQARLRLPPGDFDKWVTIESMLKETLCPVDADGNPDITQRKLKTINGAWAAFVADHPELNDQTVVAAHASGQQQVLEQVRRVTERPPTLPNNLSTADVNPDAMTIEAAQKWINTPAEVLKIWEKNKDPRWLKFQEAQEFAANQPE